MSLTVRRDRDHRRQPWANGEGVTAEIATGPDGADPFDWRMSLADVERSSDFSAFPGIDRIITLVDGTAMELTLPDRTHVLRRTSRSPSTAACRSGARSTGRPATST